MCMARQAEACLVRFFMEPARKNQEEAARGSCRVTRAVESGSPPSSSTIGASDAEEDEEPAAVVRARLRGAIGGNTKFGKFDLQKSRVFARQL